MPGTTLIISDLHNIRMTVDEQQENVSGIVDYRISQWPLFDLKRNKIGFKLKMWYTYGYGWLDYYGEIDIQIEPISDLTFKLFQYLKKEAEKDFKIYFDETLNSDKQALEFILPEIDEEEIQFIYKEFLSQK